MDTFVILRRGGWQSPEELQAAAERSRKVGDEEMSDDIRWIRSYVLEEGGGSVGTVCIYQESSPEAIRDHASRAGSQRPGARSRLQRERPLDDRAGVHTGRQRAEGAAGLAESAGAEGVG